MQPIRTSHVDALTLAERSGLLSCVISENFAAPWRVEPIGTEQRPAVLRCANADGVAISRAEMSPSRLFNPGTKRRSTEKFYLCSSSRSTTLKLEGKEPIHLEPEEFIILNSATPSEWIVPSQYTTSSLIIDSDLFHECMPECEDYIEQKLALPFGINNVLSCQMDSAWEIACAGLLRAAAPKLIRGFFDTLLLVPRLKPQPASRLCESSYVQKKQITLETWRKQIAAFIDKNYSAPDLSIAFVADRLRLSARYVQMAFAASGECPSAYLRGVRLAACARQLRDPAYQNRSITRLSLDCGFNSSAHFSTEFRKTYGITPREYRRLEQGGRSYAKPSE